MAQKSKKGEESGKNKKNGERNENRKSAENKKSWGNKNNGEDSSETTAQAQAIPPPSAVYATAIYARLSVENGGRQDGGGSLKDQIDVCRDYIAKCPGLELKEVYSDNGRTGTVFDRPAWNRLMGDAQSGKIQAIVVRDLSRFGRNYIETGNYLEKIFPALGVRFISVKENFDSMDCGGSLETFFVRLQTADMFPFHLKNLFNDFYARDISAKTGLILREKQERGQFIGTWAAYGYRKSEDGHCLVPDEKTARVVRDIFAWRAENLSFREIVRRLKGQDIPSPGRYRYREGLVRDERFASASWRPQTVKEIVENPVYLGHMVQGKQRKSLLYGQKRAAVPKEEWIIVKNTHKAIIDQDIFEKVQQINKKKCDKRLTNSNENEPKNDK